MLADAERYGDERRSQLVARRPARAIEATELIGVEPVTVVLSRSGFGARREGPRHRSRDAELQGQATGCSQRCVAAAISWPCSGPAPAVPIRCHTRCRRARGQGEPLSRQAQPARGCAVRGCAHQASLQIAGCSRAARVMPSSWRWRRCDSAIAPARPCSACRGRAGADPSAGAGEPRIEGGRRERRRTPARLLVAELPDLARGKGNKLLAVRAAEANPWSR